MKVVINRDFGVFGLSPKAYRRIAELQGRECFFFNLEFTEGAYVYVKVEFPEDEFVWIAASDQNNPTASQIDGFVDDRQNPLLVQVVEELGVEANGLHAELAIVEIPDGTQYEISDYDGLETIHEVHRIWSGD